MRRLRIVLVALAMCLMSAGYSYAMIGRNFAPMSGMSDADGRVMPKWIGAIGLDEKQTAAVKEVYFRAMKEAIRKKADMDVAEVELRELFLKEPADFKAVEAKVRQIEKLRGDIFILNMKSRDDVRSLLTSVQRRKFDLLSGMPMQGPMPVAGCERASGTGRCTMKDGGPTWGRSDEDGPYSVDRQEPGEMPDMDGSE
ncbi:MAG: hypothetical protein M0Z60_10155 [Nitrospiraceae bacterium]|nr:hypothetical protein [Nitrospiraceae bacterium]